MSKSTLMINEDNDDHRKITDVLVRNSAELREIIHFERDTRAEQNRVNVKLLNELRDFQRVVNYQQLNLEFLTFSLPQNLNENPCAFTIFESALRLVRETVQCEGCLIYFFENRQVESEKCRLWTYDRNGCKIEYVLYEEEIIRSFAQALFDGKDEDSVLLLNKDDEDDSFHTESMPYNFPVRSMMIDSIKSSGYTLAILQIFNKIATPRIFTFEDKALIDEIQPALSASVSLIYAFQDHLNVQTFNNSFRQQITIPTVSESISSFISILSMIFMQKIGAEILLVFLIHPKTKEHELFFSIPELVTADDVDENRNSMCLPMIVPIGGECFGILKVKGQLLTNQNGQNTVEPFAQKAMDNAAVYIRVLSFLLLYDISSNNPVVDAEERNEEDIQSFTYNLPAFSFSYLSAFQYAENCLRVASEIREVYRALATAVNSITKNCNIKVFLPSIDDETDPFMPDFIDFDGDLSRGPLHLSAFQKNTCQFATILDDVNVSKNVAVVPFVLVCKNPGDFKREDFEWNQNILGDKDKARVSVVALVELNRFEEYGEFSALEICSLMEFSKLISPLLKMWCEKFAFRRQQKNLNEKLGQLERLTFEQGNTLSVKNKENLVLKDELLKSLADVCDEPNFEMIQENERLTLELNETHSKLTQMEFKLELAMCKIEKAEQSIRNVDELENSQKIELANLSEELRKSEELREILQKDDQSEKICRLQLELELGQIQINELNEKLKLKDQEYERLADSWKNDYLALERNISLEKEEFERQLNLEKHSSKVMSEKLSVSNQLANDRNSDIDRLNSTYNLLASRNKELRLGNSILSNRIEKFENERNDWAEKEKLLTAQCSKLASHIEKFNMGNVILAHHAQVDWTFPQNTIASQLQEFGKAIQLSEDQCSSFCDHIENSQSEKSALPNILHDYENESSILASRMHALELKQSDLMEENITLIDDCNVKSFQIKDLENELCHLKSEFFLVTSQCNVLSSRVNDTENEKTLLASRIQQLENELSKYTDELYHVGTELLRVKEGSSRLASHIERLEIELSALKNELVLVQAELLHEKEQSSQLANRISKLENERATLNDNLNCLQTEQFELREQCSRQASNVKELETRQLDWGNEKRQYDTTLEENIFKQQSLREFVIRGLKRKQEKDLLKRIFKILKSEVNSLKQKRNAAKIAEKFRKRNVMLKWVESKKLKILFKSESRLAFDYSRSSSIKICIMLWRNRLFYAQKIKLQQKIKLNSTLNSQSKVQKERLFMLSEELLMVKNDSFIRKRYSEKLKENLREYENCLRLSKEELLLEKNDSVSQKNNIIELESRFQELQCNGSLEQRDLLLKLDEKNSLVLRLTDEFEREKERILNLTRLNDELYESSRANESLLFTLRGRLNDANECCNSLNHEIVKIKESNKHLQSEISSEISQKKNFMQILENSENENARLNSLYSELQIQHGKDCSIISELKIEIKTLSARFSEEIRCKVEFCMKLDEMTKLKENLCSEIHRHEMLEMELKYSNGENQRKLKEAKLESSQILEQLQLITDKYKELKHYSDENLERFKSLKSENEDLEKQFKSISEQLVDSNDLLKTIKDESDNYLDQLKSITNEYEDLKNQFKSISEELIDSNDLLMTTKNESDNYLNELELITAEHEDLKEQFKSISVQLIDSNVLLNKARSDLNNNLNQLKSMTDDYEDLIHQFKNVSEQLIDSNTLLMKTNDNSDQYLNQLKSITNEYEDLKREFQSSSMQLNDSNNLLIKAKSESDTILNRLKSVMAEYENLKGQFRTVSKQLSDSNDLLKESEHVKEKDIFELNQHIERLTCNFSNSKSEYEKMLQDKSDNMALLYLKYSTNRSLRNYFSNWKSYSTTKKINSAAALFHKKRILVQSINVLEYQKNMSKRSSEFKNNRNKKDALKLLIIWHKRAQVEKMNLHRIKLGELYFGRKKRYKKKALLQQYFFYWKNSALIYRRGFQTLQNVFFRHAACCVCRAFYKWQSETTLLENAKNSENLRRKTKQNQVLSQSMSFWRQFTVQRQFNKQIKFNRLVHFHQVGQYQAWIRWRRHFKERTSIRNGRSLTFKALSKMKCRVVLNSWMRAVSESKFRKLTKQTELSMEKHNEQIENLVMDYAAPCDFSGYLDLSDLANRICSAAIKKFELYSACMYVSNGDKSSLTKAGYGCIGAVSEEQEIEMWQMEMVNTAFKTARPVIKTNRNNLKLAVSSIPIMMQTDQGIEVLGVFQVLKRGFHRHTLRLLTAYSGHMALNLNLYRYLCAERSKHLRAIQAANEHQAASVKSMTAFISHFLAQSGSESQHCDSFQIGKIARSILNSKNSSINNICTTFGLDYFEFVQMQDSNFLPMNPKEGFWLPIPGTMGKSKGLWLVARGHGVEDDCLLELFAAVLGVTAKLVHVETEISDSMNQMKCTKEELMGERQMRIEIESEISNLRTRAGKIRESQVQLMAGLRNLSDLESQEALSKIRHDLSDLSLPGL